MVRRYVSILAALGLLLCLYFFPHWGEVFRILKGIPPYCILILSLLQFITLLIGTNLWYVLMKRELPYSRVLSIYLTGSLVESITPAVKLGGEAVKVYLFHHYSSLSYRDLGAIFWAHKYITLLPFLLLGGLLLIPLSMNQLLPRTFYLTFLFFLLLFFLLFLPRKKEHGRKQLLPKFGQELLLARHQWRETLSSRERRKLLLLSFCMWLLYPVKIFLVAQALKAQTHLLHSAQATFSAYLVGMIPLLPGGIGTFEGSLAYLFTRSGNPYPLGLAVALTARLFTFYLPLIPSALTALFLLYRAGKGPGSIKLVQGG